MTPDQWKFPALCGVLRNFHWSNTPEVCESGVEICQLQASIHPFLPPTTPIHARQTEIRFKNKNLVLPNILPNVSFLLLNHLLLGQRSTHTHHKPTYYFYSMCFGLILAMCFVLVLTIRSLVCYSFFAPVLCLTRIILSAHALLLLRMNEHQTRY